MTTQALGLKGVTFLYIFLFEVSHYKILYFPAFREGGAIGMSCFPLQFIFFFFAPNLFYKVAIFQSFYLKVSTPED